MLRRIFSLGARIFIALVMIGLISQQIEHETGPRSTGPKFVTPGADEQAEQDPGNLDFSTMVELAMNAARELLGDAAEEPPKSSLEQLRSRGSS
jgi:hypothetical protein